MHRFLFFICTVLLAHIAALSTSAQEPKEFKNSIGMTLVPIKAGKFSMGTPKNEAVVEAFKKLGGLEQRFDELQHEVEISQPFYIGKYEVTQAEYENVMKKNPSHFKGFRLPVENVSWNDAKAFCAKLSMTEGKVYTLPTEAEWEYCCRAGTDTLFCYGDSLIPEKATDPPWANFKPPNADAELKPDLEKKENPRELKRGTTPVGSYTPNAWGLHDMHGNVWEWCEDWRGVFYYQDRPRVDPTGPQSGKSRVMRGGSWFHDAACCRSAYRTGLRPETASFNIGFRVVCRSK